MENKRDRTLVGVIAGLTILSGGMFGYQNFYLNKKVEKEATTVYVAKSDISARTQITTDMFQQIQINKLGLLDGYVTDINEYVGKELKGGLLKGEPLSAVRVASDEFDANCNLLIKLEPDFAGEINPGENIKIYVILTDKHSGEASVRLLLDNKKVYTNEATKQNTGIVQSNSTDTTYKPDLLVRVTEEELKNYYDAKSLGKIIVSKITNIDLMVDGKEVGINSDEKNYDPDSKEAKNSYKPTDNKDNSIAVMKYMVKKGDTISTISVKFKTSEDVITKLNNNKAEFNEGEEIVVPAI